MNNKSILSELKTECSFPEVFEDFEGNTYRRKIGHIRADYDGYRWWNTIWPCHKELSTPDISAEIDKVYFRLITENAFSSLTALSEFCQKHPEAVVSADQKDEYNFYFEGEYCLFWIRCITRCGDYNIYLHAFRKN